MRYFAFEAYLPNNQIETVAAFATERTDISSEELDMRAMEAALTYFEKREAFKYGGWVEIKHSTFERLKEELA